MVSSPKLEMNGYEEVDVVQVEVNVVKVEINVVKSEVHVVKD